MISLFFSLICMGVLSVYMSAHHSTTCACGGQRRVVDHLELELQFVVSFHVGAGIPSPVFEQGSQHS